MRKRWKRLIRKTDQGAACGHPISAGTAKVNRVEMMRCDCDDLGCVAIDAAAAAAAAVEIDAAAAAPVVAIAPIED